MHILLTGSRGFIGRHFLEAAKNQGHTVTLLQSDLRESKLLEEELRSMSFTHVVHLAGISFVGSADEREFYDVNLFGTLNLLKAIAAKSALPQRILLASSANIYGNADHSPIAETTRPAPTNHYATSKLAMEHMARTYCDQLPMVFARLFNSTGPGQSRSFLIPKLVHHYIERSPVIELGNLAVEREFNDVRIVIESFLRLLDRGENGGVYNICSGQPYRLQAVIDLLSELTGHHPEIVVNPQFVRSNEVLTLCGDPTQLLKTVGPMPEFDLRDTLSWMLATEGPAESWR